MKKCPFCAEEIQDEAIKCRYCSSDLKKKKWWKGCLIGCLITIVVVVVGGYIFLLLSFLLLKFIIYKLFFAPQSQLPLPHIYPPFSGPALPGLENMFRDFSEFFRALWFKLLEVLRGTHSV